MHTFSFLLPVCWLYNYLGVSEVLLMTLQTPLLSSPYITQYSKIPSTHMHFYNVLSLLLSLALALWAVTAGNVICNISDRTRMYIIIIIINFIRTCLSPFLLTNITASQLPHFMYRPSLQASYVPFLATLTHISWRNVVVVFVDNKPFQYLPHSPTRWHSCACTSSLSLSLSVNTYRSYRFTGLV